MFIDVDNEFEDLEGEPTEEFPVLAEFEVRVNGGTEKLEILAPCYADAYNAAAKYVKAAREMNEGQR